MEDEKEVGVETELNAKNEHDHDHLVEGCKCEQRIGDILPGDIVELNPEMDYLYIVGTQGKKSQKNCWRRNSNKV